MNKFLFSFVCAFLGISMQALAYEGTLVRALRGQNIQVQSGTLGQIVVWDQDFDINYGSTMVMADAYINVVFKFDERVRKNYSANAKIIVKYDIELYEPGVVSPVVMANEEISIFFLRAGTYEDIAIKKYKDGNKYRKARLLVKGIYIQPLNDDGTDVGSPYSYTQMPSPQYDDLVLEVQSYTKKYFELDKAPIDAGAIVHTVYDGSTHVNPPVLAEPMSSFGSCATPKYPQKNEVTIGWLTVPGAESYDLEWVFVDYGEKDLCGDFLDFDWRNATRINTVNNFFTFPLLYPKGRVVYRVRAVGVELAEPDIPRYAQWSRSDGYRMDNTEATKQSFAWCGHSTRFNWTSQTSYAEEGKTKSVVAYIDGYGKSRQTLTYLSTEGLTALAEPVYDHVGRPAVSPLPVVMPYDGLMFQSLVNASFDKTDFDTDERLGYNPDPAVVPTLTDIPAPMSTTATESGKFYSPNNDFVVSPAPTPFGAYRKTLAEYIPDVSGYAYTQTRYMNDGSNRPHSQGGVGLDHRLGSGHETKYYYGAPTGQAEIDRFFGNEAGFVANYSKEMVVDANGQVSVSYKDGAGKVVATALAGVNVNSLHHLPSSSSSPVFTQSLLDDNNINAVGELVSSKDFLVSTPQTVYKLNYAAQPGTFQDLCLGTHKCFFEVSISIVNEDGVQVLDFDGDTQLGNEPSWIPMDPDSPFVYHDSLTLNIGKYTVLKRVRIDPDAYAGLLIDVNTFLGDDYRNSACFDTIALESPCSDCERDCEEAFTYTYTLGGTDYTVYKPDEYNGVDYTTGPYVGLTTDTAFASVAVDEWGNPLFRLVSPGVGAYIDSLINVCKGECGEITVNPNNDCGLILTMLQKDLMPGGQYFDNSPQDPDNSSNTLYNYTDPGNYGQVTNRNFWLVRYAEGTYGGHDFLSDFGALAGLTGSYTWDDIRSHWGTIRDHAGFPALMADFVQLHPEYCLYRARCEGRDTVECSCGGQGLIFPPMYTSLQEYETLLYNTNGDMEARNLALFSPAGAFFYGVSVGMTFPYDQYAAPWHVGAINNDTCLYDPIIRCKSGEVINFLNNYQTITLNDSQPFTYSLYYLITDPENLHLIDTTTYSGNYPNGFIGWMIQLHGDGGSMQGLLAPFNTPPLAGQMTRFQFFKNTYMALRMQMGQLYTQQQADTCMMNNSRHPLSDLLTAKQTNSCTLPASVDQASLPYLSALDMNGDAVVDLDISTAPCPGAASPPHISLRNFKIRIPYIDFSNFTDPLSPSNTNCEDLADNLSNIFVQRMVNNVSGCVKLEAPSGTNGNQYHTPQYVLSTAHRDILKDYIGRIVEASCLEFNAAASGGSLDITNFSSVDVASGVSWSGLTWGIPYDPADPTRYSVDGVVALWKAQVGDEAGCPANLNALDLYSPGPPTMNDFACSCNKVADIIRSAGGLKDPYMGINPVKYSVVVDSGLAGPDNIFDYDTIKTYLAGFGGGLEWMLAPYTSADFGSMSAADMKTILLHWLNSCNDSSDTELDSLTALPGFGQFPNMALCGDDTLAPPPIPTCEENFQAYLTLLNQQAFQDFKEQQFIRFNRLYGSICLQNLKPTETFTAEFALNEYHFTLYYYDRAGNLVKTVPPQGVVQITGPAELTAIHRFRLNYAHTDVYETATDPIYGDQFNRPPHTKATVYAYNSKNQPLRQQTPDGGESNFYYDFLGRIAYSRNAQQATDDKGSYTRYDAQGRVVEVGGIRHSGLDASAYQNLTQMVESLPAHPGDPTPFDGQVDASIHRSEITATYYDNSQFSVWGISAPVTQQNLRGRVVSSGYYEALPSDWKLYDNATHYSYDIHGNVKDLLQDIPGLAEFDRRYLLTNYEYDLLSGKVNALHYMKGHLEAFSHYYTYDSDNRLTRVYTSENNGFTRELEAKYYYHLTGPLARVELGRHQVQGLDYTYTSQGWLKGVNGDYLNAKHDRGRDGYNGAGDQLHSNFGVDAMGYTLGYFTGDYTAIGSGHYRPFELVLAGGDAPLAHLLPANAYPYGLYNGNISKMVSNTLGCDELPLDAMGRFYTYDQLNRIRTAKHMFIDNDGYLDNTVTASWGSGVIDNGYYDMSVEAYDADGNILRLKRNGNQPGSDLLMDDLRYSYLAGTNRLDSVGDEGTDSTAYGNDFNPGQEVGNYRYDAIGNLIYDHQNDQSNIAWNLYGKVKAVDFAGTRRDLGFYYNPTGQRIVKTEGVLNDPGGKFTFYALDAQGNVLAIYEAAVPEGVKKKYTLNCSERMIYGSSRVGMLQKDVTIKSLVTTFSPDHLKASEGTGSGASGVSVPPPPAPGYVEHYHIHTGFKLYELSNHLGNVLTTVSDRKVWVIDQDIIGGKSGTELFRYRPDVMMYTEYYPFGSPLPGWECKDEKPKPQVISDTRYEYIHQSDFDSYPVAYNVPPNTSTSGWTVWGGSPSNTSVQNRSGSDDWLQVNSTHSSHGTHQYFNTVPGTSYTIRYDLDLGTTDQVNLLVWDVTPGGTLYNLRVIQLAAGGDGLVQNFTAGDTRVLIQFRQDDMGSLSFYLDNVDIWSTVTGIVNVAPMDKSYRYGFNAQEKDDEIYGEGNTYSFEHRIYDSRLGRFLSVDPISSEYPWNSSYAFAENDVIRAIDIEGKEKEIVITVNDENNNKIYGYTVKLDNPGPMGDGKVALTVNLNHMKIPTSVDVSYQYQDENGKTQVVSATAELFFSAEGTLTIGAGFGLRSNGFGVEVQLPSVQIISGKYDTRTGGEVEYWEIDGGNNTFTEEHSVEISTPIAGLEWSEEIRGRSSEYSRTEMGRTSSFTIKIFGFDIEYKPDGTTTVSKDIVDEAASFLIGFEIKATVGAEIKFNSGDQSGKAAGTGTDAKP